jgi:hypothetical protein
METEKKSLILKHLQDWQNSNYELVETPSDIKVFNTIGLIVGMTNSNLFDLSKSHEFITEILSLNEEESKKAYKVIIDAYMFADNEGGDKQ